MTKPVLIAATGTEIGKTLISAALCHQWRRNGLSVWPGKPVISGWSGVAESDTGILLDACGLPVDDAHIEAVSPYRLAAPLSPDMAAVREGVTLDPDRMVSAVRALEAKGADRLLVEMAGGVMSPVTAEHTALDLAERLGYPILLVAGSYLGTISHTLTAIVALRQRGLFLRGVVLSESPEAAVYMEEVRDSILRMLAEPLPVAMVPRLAPHPRIWENAPDLTWIADGER